MTRGPEGPGAQAPGRSRGIAAATWAIPKAGGWLATNPGVQNYLASGLGQGLVRNALAFPSRAGLGAAVPAYMLSQE